MRTTIEMAREAAGDDWGLFQEYMPEIHRLAELVRADERARMAEQPAQQEPIYQYQMANGSWIDQTKESHDYNVRHGQATVRVVYTSPPAQRKPLTNEEIRNIWSNGDCFEEIAFARAIEAAHGIKENT